jgi:hypothetical protein
MTVNETVSRLKALLKEYDRSPGVMTDQMIWENWVIAKDRVIGQRLNQHKHLNQMAYVTICMELEKAKSHECGCILVGCDVLKTVHPLTQVLSSTNSNKLRVMTLDNTIIDPINEWEFNYFDKYDPIYQDKLLYSIVNQHIVIWNNLDLKVIQVSGVWSDVTKLADIQYCKDNNNTNLPCVDVYNKNIGNFDAELVDMIDRVFFERMNIPLSLREDELNDSNANIK